MSEQEATTECDPTSYSRALPVPRTCEPVPGSLRCISQCAGTLHNSRIEFLKGIAPSSTAASSTVQHRPARHQDRRRVVRAIIWRWSAALGRSYLQIERYVTKPDPNWTRFACGHFLQADLNEAAGAHAQNPNYNVVRLARHYFHIKPGQADAFWDDVASTESL